MVATNLIGKKVTTPEAMILQQIDERNTTWAEEDSAWDAETTEYQTGYDAFVQSKPSRDADYTNRLNSILTNEWVPTNDPGFILSQMEAARNTANSYADQRQSDFITGLTNMQNARAERVGARTSQLSSRSKQLEQYLNLRAEDAKASQARSQGLAAAQQQRSNASFLTEDERFAKKRTFLGSE